MQVAVGALHVLIRDARGTLSTPCSLPPLPCNSSRQDFKQRKKEKKRWLTFSSFFFSSSLLPAASTMGLQWDHDSLLEIMKSKFADRRVPHAAVPRGRRALPAEKRRNKSTAMPERG